MSIATLAQGARQSLARGLEALQARDAPLGLLDVAEPVARAISGLVDLELEPLEASPARVEPVLDALRESLQLLQAPEFVEHPAAARGMKGVAEALGVVVTLARRARESAQTGNGAPAAPGAFARSAREDSGAVHTPAAAPRSAQPVEAAAPRAATPAAAAPAAAAPAAATPAAAAPAAATPAAAAPAAAAPAVVASPTVVASPVVPAPWAAPAPAAAAPPVVGAPVASVPAPSMRPSLRSLAPSADSNEPAVVTRAVNAVMGPAPASIVDSTPPARFSTPPSVRADAAQALRVEPQPARIESQPARIEPQPARIEPSISLRDPEPPPLITSRPTEAAEAPAPQRALEAPAPQPALEAPAPQSALEPPAPQRAVDARGSTPSRAPVSIRRDVIVERDLRAVDAPLGAHSASNFYTGLAGGDVVASGGLFVATYQVPKLGEKVLLKISMPGGYEFLAKAKVAWTRDITGSLGAGSMRGVQSAPGFGAQFCEITEEGRRLIQRYVRNREPLFHEDSP